MKTADAIETYELRRTVTGGRPDWKWKVKGTLVWTHAYTRIEAELGIKADAKKKGAAYFIEEKGL
jgi:hypothetical protein